MFPIEQLFLGHLQQQTLEQRWELILNHRYADEVAFVQQLIGSLQLSQEQQHTAEQQALRWTQQARQQPQHSGFDAILQEYDLDTPEGLALMTLAEALIRIPDGPTADALIRDRLKTANWQHGASTTSSTWVNLSGWALSQAKQWLDSDFDQAQTIQRVVHKLGDPILRTAIQQAIKLLADRYIIAESIYEALDRAQDTMGTGTTYSFDMLGEAALQDADSDRFRQAYLDAIMAVGMNESYPEAAPRPSVSVKLSALHPRFESAQGHRMLTELTRQMTPIIQQAVELNVAITIDAEECDRLEPTLQVLERLLKGPAKGWGQLGIAVQAYAKSALPVLHWLQQLGNTYDVKIPVRLVKGAYWDTEVKRAQQRGENDYPVYTRKSATDIAYLACAQYLFSEFNDQLIPQFATHNALTLSQLNTLSPESRFECQRLQGMGATLHRIVTGETDLYTRIYAPVGRHRQLLPYLIRRLLENSANSSFVRQLSSPHLDSKSLVKNPLTHWLEKPAYGVPLPAVLFQPRLNSKGINLALAKEQQRLLSRTSPYRQHYYFSAPLIDGEPVIKTAAEPQILTAPGNLGCSIGECYLGDIDDVAAAYQSLTSGQQHWRETAVEYRALVVERYASLLESHTPELLRLLVREAGKTWADAQDEVREAIDFCRYYAAQAKQLQIKEHPLPAVTGEANTLSYHPRGVFLCISPWNFPVAILTGQVIAALVTGNTVLVKPSGLASLLAYRCAQLLLEAGLPANALALLPGKGAIISAALLNAPNLSGVAFTGSGGTAKSIQQTLAQRADTKIIPLIAETAGQNAMIADSSTLIDQLVRDVMQSAFSNAGQRCSALRVLYLQEEIYAETVQSLKGAMAKLVVGSPDQLSTDIGPIISDEALYKLNLHLSECKQQDKLLYQTPLTADTPLGNYLPPALIALESLDELNDEHFGPILHVIKYASKALDQVISDINESGFGLTLGIHSRNESFIQSICQRVQVGNIYVNRNQIGAVVECQPFGGTGASGTGPKAGGPNYLRAFTFEQTKTINQTAWGGNISLLNQTETKS